MPSKIDPRKPVKWLDGLLDLASNSSEIIDLPRLLTALPQSVSIHFSLGVLIR